MHSSLYEAGNGEQTLANADVLVAITTLVTEGRIPDKINTNFRGYSEGPHCHKSKSSINHTCSEDQFLCARYEKQRSHVLALWQKSIPICVEVLLTTDCECGKSLANNLDTSSGSKQQYVAPSTSSTSATTTSQHQQLNNNNNNGSTTTTETLLLEQWFLAVEQRRSKDTSSITTQQLLNAVRSQLHFSQLAAWLSIKPDNNLTASVPSPQAKNIIYRITLPGETFKQSKFDANYNEHVFPLADIGNNNFLKVSMQTLPRLEKIPKLNCHKCQNTDPLLTTIPNQSPPFECCKSAENLLLDDRMHYSCTKHGKHKCTYDEEDVDLDLDNRLKETELKHKSKVRCLHPNKVSEDALNRTDPTASTSNINSLYPTRCNDTADLLCRKDYESFIQNQTSRVTTVNYFLVPSTSNCVLKTNYSNSSVPKKSTDTACSNSKTHQTSGFHENQYIQLGKYFGKQSQCSCSFNGVVQRPSTSAERDGFGDQDDLNTVKTKQSKGDILLNAIMRSSRKDEKTHARSCETDEEEDTESGDTCCVNVEDQNASGDSKCDFNLSDNNINIYSFTYANQDKNNCDSLACNNRSCSNNIGDPHHSPDSSNPSTRPNTPNKKHDKPPRLTIRNNITRLIHENRHDLYKNGSALETKRKIDFEALDNKRTQLNCSNNHQTELDNECEMYINHITTTNHQPSEVPSVLDQKKFRKSLDDAASMVFHSRTGLPLTSSPAPIRKGTKCFDFDSKLNSVSAIRSALFELSPNAAQADEDSESDCSAVSPCSPDINICFPRTSRRQKKRINTSSRSGLLGTFEESVLHGRLEPVSTVQGFTAELGASGLFCPNHQKFPVTVFFYSLGDMDRMSAPYLGHINLGKKGYNVPKSGLVQITLFNPLGTVVKMFVVSYDLSDMPSNSQTFIRQRTLYLPQNCPDLQRPDLEYSDRWGQKYLRFLIHLRFMSSKSGRIYLYRDIRMIIFNKSDMDTATGLTESGYEMRSFIYCPTNPKYSPRK